MDDLAKRMAEVLKMNDRGNYTQPAHGLYPHQWLWDSCFIAIGLRHLDVSRAQSELASLLRGQWSNGMLPNIIFREDKAYRTDRNMWHSWVNPESPTGVTTTGITQPPMLAEAVMQVGAKLDWPERRQWYKQMLPALIEYHQWMYHERDPHGEGLVLLIHPWETGLDNTPPWIAAMRQHQMPIWIRLVELLGVDRVVNLFRRDTRSVPIDERFSTVEALQLFDIQRRLKRKSYVTRRVLDHGMFAIEDLAFNSILVRANSLLREMAKSVKAEIPEDLLNNMHKTTVALDQLWDASSGEYFSRDFITHDLLRESSVATLLPLYAGTIKRDRAQQLVQKLENAQAFGPAYPLPSVPVNSSWFHPKLYWQGPSWVNINWLVIQGLERYGFNDHAEALRESTLEMIAQSGSYEYFDPLTGEGAGAANFSWTAALAIDLIKKS